MQVLVACDKFKGSINATDLCDLIGHTLLTHDQKLNINVQPLADGGDGTLAILQSSLALKKVSVEAIDPLGRSITAFYLSDGIRAYIELAEASGIVHLEKSELDIMSTTTIGTGNLIKHAIENGHQEITLSLGGSCTNDMGIGIASALGFKFLDNQGSTLKPNGGNLSHIQDIKQPNSLPDFKLTILCDVENPLHGPNGAAHIFGPQKGASPEQVIHLDKGMKHFSKVLLQKYNKAVDQIRGGGAAGGIGAGLLALIPEATMTNGFNYLSNLIKLEEKVITADLIISGEGQLDQSSFQGKVVGNMYAYSQKHQIPLAIIVGKNTFEEDLDASVYEVAQEASSTQDSFENIEKYLILITKKIYLDFVAS